MPRSNRKQAVADLVAAAVLYDQEHRRSFPWRQTSDPYHILVSEFMLQQTQTSRVQEKYPSFLHTFPSIDVLARAKQQQVLSRWSGLGYNRRALALQKTAQCVVRDHGGTVPESEETLLSFPGIGAYTAAAIVIFAYNKPAVAIETNIRTIIKHHCRVDSEASMHKVMLLVIREARRRRLHPRDLYAALMDYGAHLKTLRVPAARPQAPPQKKFAGSVRQARGLVVRMLVQEKVHVTDEPLSPCTRETWTKALAGLVREGVIERKSDRYSICS